MTGREKILQMLEQDDNLLEEVLTLGGDCPNSLGLNVDCSGIACKNCWGYFVKNNIEYKSQ